MMKTRYKSDVTICVKNQKIQAHRAILSARSPVFASMLEYDTKEKQEGVIEITDIEPSTIRQFLHYVYSGEMPKVKLQEALYLYTTADKYDVSLLKMECAMVIGKQCTADAFCDLMIFSNIYNERKLQDTLSQYFMDNMGIIMRRDHWLYLLKNHNDIVSDLLLKFTRIQNEKDTPTSIPWRPPRLKHF